MYLDIIIFAAIAAFLIFRLNAILGSRHGGERDRKNPFAGGAAQGAPAPVAAPEVKAQPPKRQIEPLMGAGQLVDAAANQDGRIETGLAEIAAADPLFELNGFMQGARAAFEMIVTAYNKGDREVLKPLLSPKLYKDFDQGIQARESVSHVSEVIIHRIKAARINEAHLGGTMAYITVDFDVEETTVVRDASGTIVEGSPDRIFSVEDIWTFSRDIRATDPNWTLIETRSVEK